MSRKAAKLAGQTSLAVEAKKPVSGHTLKAWRDDLQALIDDIDSILGGGKQEND